MKGYQHLEDYYWDDRPAYPDTMIKQIILIRLPGIKVLMQLSMQ